jgi:hypothetical protein
VVTELKQRFIVITKFILFRNKIFKYQKIKRTLKILLKNGLRTPILKSTSIVTTGVSGFIITQTISWNFGLSATHDSALFQISNKRSDLLFVDKSNLFHLVKTDQQNLFSLFALKSRSSFADLDSLSIFLRLENVKKFQQFDS